ncbi:MAG: DNA methyltransferase [Armatimonadota bacterium]
MNDSLQVNHIYHGDCRDILASFPEESVDVIFADPPYNLQLDNELWRPNLTKVDAVNDDWDDFDDFEAYDRFTESWLRACRRVLKETGTLWVIGSYHNIYRVGKIMMDLGYWILNDVVWIKTNPMPNFRGTRLANAHETLLWVKRSEQASGYTFNYHAMKQYNDGKQLRSDWTLPLCSGSERIRVNGEKAHSTQKPEALLERVIMASSKVGDLILDPFFGTGTTGAVAKKMGRKWIGIEIEESYIDIARERISAVPRPPAEALEDLRDQETTKKKRVPFKKLLELGLLCVGDDLVDKSTGAVAEITEDAFLAVDGLEGSIHQVAAALRDAPSANGWTIWQYTDDDGELRLIDDLREAVRRREK